MTGIVEDPERAAIAGAIGRLLEGRPVRSTGALNIVQLAAEAGVKRWVLTHKHTDLKDDFQRRVRDAGKLPSAFQALEDQIIDLKAENQRLRAEKRNLQARIELYAAVINELSIRRHRYSQAGKVSKLWPARTVQPEET